MDLDRILERWKKDNHTLGAQKANRGDVIQRLERDGKKHTIFDDSDLLDAREEGEGEEGGEGAPATAQRGAMPGIHTAGGGWWWRATTGLKGHWEWREE